MEIMVVLLITGAASTILFQALDNVYRMQGRFGEGLDKAHQSGMTMDWFRLTVSGLISDPSDAELKFAGSGREWSGLSINPLSEDAGIPTRIKWELEFDPADGLTHLVYHDGDRRSNITAWQGGEAQFVYVDRRRERHDSWPPAMGSQDSLPQVILVEAVDRGDAINVVAAPPGERATQLRPQDIFRGAR